MKKVICNLIFVLVLWSNLARSQQADGFQPYGQGEGRIFANFHKGISPASSDEAAFELVRAYLGYRHILSPEISARITLDIGSPDDISPYSRLRRYAYFKYAYVQYMKNDLTFQFGLIGTLQFDLQEQLWERRYLKKAFADEFKLGPSADLGALIEYRFSDIFQADLTMMNGEGYTRLQMDDVFKYAIGATLSYPGSLISRIYVDFMRGPSDQVTYTWVSSYTHQKNLNLTFEYNYQQNTNLLGNHDLFGYSMYGKYNITPVYQLFARYDILRSNIPPGRTNPWHLADDGSMLIGGIQYSPLKSLKVALNYQDWVPWAANLPNRSYVYLDLEIKL